MAYALIFAILAITALLNSKKKEFYFVLSIIILLLWSLSIPKIQEIYLNANIFFTSSRFYLTLPLLLILSLYLTFKHLKFKARLSYYLLTVCVITLVHKNLNINEKVYHLVTQTSFPVAKTQDLILRANKLKQMVERYNVDLIVHSTSSGWSYIFDSYAFNLLTSNTENLFEKTISVNLDSERRSWLFSKSMNSKQILLNGFKIDPSLMKNLDYEILNKNQILIKNNHLKVSELLMQFDFKYGDAYN